MKGGSTVTSKSIGGSKWGTRDATPVSKFFNFHAVLGKKLQNNRLAHPLFHAVLGKKYCQGKGKCICIVPITVWSGARVLEVGSVVCGESDDEESTT